MKRSPGPSVAVFQDLLLCCIVFGGLVFGCLGFASSAPASPATECNVSKSTWTGAYYYKMISPLGFYGFSGTIILPRFTMDLSCPFADRTCRYLNTAPDLGPPVEHDGESLPYFNQPLDAASVYVGCVPSNDIEIDAGLNWEPIIQDGHPVLVDSWNPAIERDPQHRYTLWMGANQKKPELRGPGGALLASGWTQMRKVINEKGLKPFFAFVPFWRTDVWNASRDLFFLPGERTLIEIEVKGNGLFNLHIQSLDYLTSTINQDFEYPAAIDTDQMGYACKRVNSIDQFIFVPPNLIVGNEAGLIADPTVQATHAHTGPAQWTRSELIQGNGNHVPFAPPLCTSVRGQDTWIRYNEIFNSSGIDPQTGAETITITP